MTALAADGERGVQAIGGLRRPRRDREPPYLHRDSALEAARAQLADEQDFASSWVCHAA